MAEAGVLRAVLEAPPFHEALLAAAARGEALPLQLEEVRPVHRAFAPMVRDLAYDLCELAVVTALQALEAGRPIVLLPAVVAARRQRGCLVTLTDRAVADPTELRGARVGVRSYTQTTGMWVRQHLGEDFDLPAEAFSWITKEEAHVAEYHDPSFVRRELTGSVVDALRAGEVDAAILGNDLPPGEFAPVFSDAESRDEEWCRSHGYVPVNHLVTVSTAALHAHPGAVRAAYRVLRRVHEQLSEQTPPPAPTLFGVASLAKPLQEVVATCVDQGLLARSHSVDELLAPAVDLLDHPELEEED